MLGTRCTVIPEMLDVYFLRHEYEIKTTEVQAGFL